MIDDGGPAYPFFCTDEHDCGSAGMSLLDHFAGLAMQGLLVHSESTEFYSKGPCNLALVGRAYDLAGEMLAERKRRMEEQP